MRREIGDAQSKWWRDVEKLKDDGERSLARLQYLTLLVIALVVAISAFLLFDGRRRFAEIRRVQSSLSAANEDLDRNVAEKTRHLAVALNDARYALAMRDRAEAALRESEQRLRLLIEASSNSIFRMDADWREMRRLSGAGFLAAVENVEVNWIERFIPDDERQTVVAAVQKAIRTKGVFQLEHRVFQAGGAVGWTLSRAVPLLDGDDKIAEWFGVAIDVTARKQAEKALQASEARLRRFYEAGLVGVMYWNVGGEITDANDKFLDLVGYTREDLEGGRILWRNLTNPERRDQDAARVRELQAPGAAPVEKEYVRKDGSTIPVIVAGTMLDEGRRDGVAFVLDISKQKEAEKAVRANEAALARNRKQLRFAANAAGLTYADIDIPTGRLSVDENFENVMGYRPPAGGNDRSIAELVARLIRSEDGSASPSAVDAVQALLATGRQTRLEHRIRGDDGVERWIEFVVSAENGPDQKPARIFLTSSTSPPWRRPRPRPKGRPWPSPGSLRPPAMTCDSPCNLWSCCSPWWRSTSGRTPRRSAP